MPGMLSERTMGFYAKGRIKYLLKRYYMYKAGPSDTIEDISGALETFRIQMADTKAEYEPHDAVMAIALISTVDDPAFDTTKQLLERDPNLTLETAKEALKATEQRLKIEKKTPPTRKLTKQAPREETDHRRNAIIVKS